MLKFFIGLLAVISLLQGLADLPSSETYLLQTVDSPQLSDFVPDARYCHRLCTDLLPNGNRRRFPNSCTDYSVDHRHLYDDHCAQIDLPDPLTARLSDLQNP